jgi:hypothetical protein
MANTLSERERALTDAARRGAGGQGAAKRLTCWPNWQVTPSCGST